MKSENPFTQLPIKDPALLIGRKTLQQDILYSLDSGPVFFRGGRRTGKTSLLKCLAHDKSNFHYWDAQRLGKDMDLAKAARYFGMENGLEETIKSTKKGNPLILLIDEFDALTQSDRFSKEDYENLRSMVMEYSPDHFALLVSSSLQQEELQLKMHGSRLLNSFNLLNMTSLEIDTGGQFYTFYLEKVGLADYYEQNKEIFKKAKKMAAQHPWLLQITGMAAVSAGGDIGKFQNSVRATLPTVKKTFTTLLSQLDTTEAALFCVQAIGGAQFDAGKNARYETLGLTCKGRVPELFQYQGMDWLENNYNTGNNDNEDLSILLQRLAHLDKRNINELDKVEQILLAHGARRALISIDNGKITLNNYKNDMPCQANQQ